MQRLNIYSVNVMVLEKFLQHVGRQVLAESVVFEGWLVQEIIYLD